MKYFFFIAWRWNPLLALFVLYHEIKGEKKYGIDTIGTDDLHLLEDIGVDTSHAAIYMPVNYFLLENLMGEIVKYENNGGFLDLGCGKGRVLVVAAHYGFREIVGLDFHPDLCEDAKIITARCKEKIPDANFTVINNDAFYFEIPSEISTIFLFNPFDEVIMSGVIGNILESHRESPRTIRVIYDNPVYKSLFLEDGFKEIYNFKKLNYLEGSILEMCK